MEAIKSIDTIERYNDYFGVATRHPLVTVIDARREAQPVHFCPKLYHIYAILLKDIDCGALKYGRGSYDYQQGTMLFISPGQVMGSADDGTLHQPDGWVLGFHPDFIHRSALQHLLQEYSFFSYSANEALHLSEPERETIISCMRRIKEELDSPIDRHTKALVIENIKLLLSYCQRFYDRQFITRKPINSDLLTRFEILLADFFHTGQALAEGLPSVRYFADKLCLSPSYLSDLLKKETGKTALRHIQLKAVDVAKAEMSDPAKSLSQVGYQLGFPYPQHFSRWFKKMTGQTPTNYREALIATASSPK